VLLSIIQNHHQLLQNQQVNLSGLLNRPPARVKENDIMRVWKYIFPVAYSCGFLIAQAKVVPPSVAKAPNKTLAAPPVSTPEAPSLLDEELLVIKLTPYKPTLVRDPFNAPSDVANENKGDLIDDLGVKGRITSGGKVLAVISDSRGNVRWLPVGFKFKDGELYEITDKAVIFHQRDVNSTTPVFRTVVKPFKREGVK
jgi:hypothetical protein